MTKAEFITWAKSRGWEEDKFGHFRKVTPATAEHLRFKLSNVAVRCESQITHSGGSHEWVRIQSGYLKDLHVTPDNRLAGLKY